MDSETEMTSVEEREDAITSNPNYSEKMDDAGNVVEKDDDFTRFSPMWNEVVNAILMKAGENKSFLNEVVRTFANENLATSNLAKEIFKSAAAGIAVYGKLNMKTPEGLTERGFPRRSQYDLVFDTLRQHKSILFDRFHESVGIITNEKTGKLERAPF